MKNYFTEEKAKQKCEELGIEYVGNSKTEKANHTMVQYICPIHREKGIQEAAWGHFRMAKKGCPYCIGRHITTEEAQKKVLNPNIIFTSEYLGCEKPISCHCNKCGNDWVTNRPMDLFKRKGGCPQCANNNRGNFHRKKLNDFIKDVATNNPNVEIISSYNLTKNKIRCKCKKCDTEWESIAANIRNGSARCPYCHGTTGERRIIDFLKKYKINFLTQKTFDDCKNSSGRKLRFDVYDVDNNILFEYQGEYHFEEKPYYGDIEKAKKSLETRKERDALKRQYCKSHNIILIEIPYWELDNIESFIFAKVELYRKKYM